jgi:hypothetical protein
MGMINLDKTMFVSLGLIVLGSSILGGLQGFGGGLVLIGILTLLFGPIYLEMRRDLND